MASGLSDGIEREVPSAACGTLLRDIRRQKAAGRERTARKQPSGFSSMPALPRIAVLQFQIAD